MGKSGIYTNGRIENTGGPVGSSATLNFATGFLLNYTTSDGLAIGNGSGMLASSFPGVLSETFAVLRLYPTGEGVV